MGMDQYLNKTTKREHEWHLAKQERIAKAEQDLENVCDELIKKFSDKYPAINNPENAREYMEENFDPEDLKYFDDTLEPFSKQLQQVQTESYDADDNIVIYDWCNANDVHEYIVNNCLPENGNDNCTRIVLSKDVISNIVKSKAFGKYSDDLYLMLNGVLAAWNDDTVIYYLAWY